MVKEGKLPMPNRLRDLGYKNYREYLSSSHWKSVKQAYYNNKSLPQYCIGCKSHQFQLHHRSYVRLGDERVGDLIPLCVTCHKAVHVYLKTHQTQLAQTMRALQKVLGVGRGEIKKRFRPFSKSKSTAFNTKRHL